MYGSGFDPGLPKLWIMDGSDADPYYGSHPDPFDKNQPRTIPKIKIRCHIYVYTDYRPVLRDFSRGGFLIRSFARN